MRKELIVCNFIKTFSLSHTCAQVVSLCREAALCAMRERIDIEKVALRHFEQVLAVLKPQTKESTLRLYQNYLKQ